LLAGLLSAASVLATETIAAGPRTLGVMTSLFSEDGFMPHGHCYLWSKSLVTLHVLSDGLIFFSYLVIPGILIYFVRTRRDLRFGWMFVCFAIFIVACGTTHLMEIWNVWNSNYWVAGAVKGVTALASVPTAVLLAQLVVQALALPTMSDLQALNDALGKEVAARGQAESAARALNEELERRVAERTAQLNAANADLLAQMAQKQHAEQELLESREQPRRMLGVLADVTDRTRAEQTAMQLAAIVDSSSTASSVTT
jgi:hypothetical protein